MKYLLIDLMRVLRRPVELAGQSGHKDILKELVTPRPPRLSAWRSALPMSRDEGLHTSSFQSVLLRMITVNCIGPGWIETPSSDEASYLTSQLIVVDGGNTIQEYHGPS